MPAPSCSCLDVYVKALGHPDKNRKALKFFSMNENKIEELFDLKNKLVLITGGQGDLGSEYARALVLVGAKVAIFDVSRRINPKIEKLISQGYVIKNFCLD